MLLKGLIVLLSIQFILFITGLFLNKKITAINRYLGIFLKGLYIADSFVMISYVIFFAIYVFKQNSAYYNFEGIKVNYYLFFAIIIFTNFFKLIFFLCKKIIRKKKRSMCRDENLILSIYYLICVSILINLFSILSEKVSYIPNGNIQLIEKNSFVKVELVKKDNDEIKTNQYEFKIINSNNKTIKIEEGDLKVLEDTDRYVEKYQVIEIIEDCFGNKRNNISYEYKIYTPDETERNLILLLYNN